MEGRNYSINDLGIGRVEGKGSVIRFQDMLTSASLNLLYTLDS